MPELILETGKEICRHLPILDSVEIFRVHILLLLV